jgi:hypothetical protein
MAFAIRDLSVLAYANGFTLWHYRAGDEAPSDIATENYFADAADMMTGGDIVMISGSQGCRVLCIAQTDAGSVRVAPMG